MMAHITAEAQAAIICAERVFFLVTHPLAEAWMRELNPRAESLARFYQPQRERALVYRDITDHVLAAVRTGSKVCVAFYGHPRVCVTPTQDMVRQAREEGYMATVLPGISAEDCLFADIGLDPGAQGCQSYEASDFVLRPRQFDPSTLLVLWQVGLIGYFGVVNATIDPSRGLTVLKMILRKSYPGDHLIMLYEAAMMPTSDPIINKVVLDELEQASVTSYSTLYVPPVALPAIDAEMLYQLGLTSLE